MIQEGVQVIYCPICSQEGRKPVAPSQLPPEGHTDGYPHVAAELSGFSPHPKQDGLETGSPDNSTLMNKHEPSLVP